MSAKIPAWKRLGLKLKQPASGSEIGGPAPADGSKPNGHQQHHDRPVVNAANASAAAAKRKRPEHSSAPPAFSSPLKRTRTDGHAATPPTLRKQKSVTFADDTKNPAAAEPTKTKKKSKKAKPATQPQQADIKPSLEYLRNWKHARQAWKFNKNYQTILMKRVFQPDSIPSSDIDTFYEYIRDLKGYTRTRLRETAAEVKQEDAAKGAAGFPDGTPNMDSKQSEYEKVLVGLMQLGSDGGKRKRFDEPGFVSQSSDVAVTQRVIKRMRAETILDELAESEDSDAMTIDTEETANTSAAAAQEEEPVDKRAKLNDGTRQRSRKKRITADDSSSDESSDDDSDDDDTSSSGSSSDDSDNESEMQRQAAQRDAETSSSSSSSSEDEDDSSDDDSSDEEENTKRPAGKRR
ncbi:proteasome subunit alpha type 6 [Colletotrichum musicola]|uniref:Proteasome subunit alpha type 6 n=1 Tax=Colletotrichum musicola TaxID=2175873 RepID=A0A8H6KGS6_9PEZI|nr:proteasome subunit alpha type 6 [Colletotrichum musicola]